jgi:hypothetical protein
MRLGRIDSFDWQDNGTAVDAWWFYAGSTLGGHQYLDSGNLDSATNTTFSGQPVDAETVFVRLWYLLDGDWLHIDEQYQAPLWWPGFKVVEDEQS